MALPFKNHDDCDDDMAHSYGWQSLPLPQSVRSGMSCQINTYHESPMANCYWLAPKLTEDKLKPQI